MPCFVPQKYLTLTGLLSNGSSGSLVYRLVKGDSEALLQSRSRF
jgi:hypothetical protein